MAARSCSWYGVRENPPKSGFAGAAPFLPFLLFEVTALVFDRWKVPATGARAAPCAPMVVCCRLNLATGDAEWSSGPAVDAEEFKWPYAVVVACLRCFSGETEFRAELVASFAGDC